MVTIKSTSPDGVWYLVNGWDEWKAFWWDRPVARICGFKTAGLAKRSLNRLLKAMPEYAGDQFEIVSVDDSLWE